jgi:GTPase SAR1 family protein
LDVRFDRLFIRVNLLVFVLCCVFQRVLQIKTHSWEKIPVMLVGNKCDMADERVVQPEDGEKLVSELGTYIREK